MRKIVLKSFWRAMMLLVIAPGCDKDEDNSSVQTVCYPSRIDYTADYGFGVEEFYETFEPGFDAEKKVISFKYIEDGEEEYYNFEVSYNDAGLIMEFSGFVEQTDAFEAEFEYAGEKLSKMYWNNDLQIELFYSPSGVLNKYIAYDGDESIEYLLTYAENTTVNPIEIVSTAYYNGEAIWSNTTTYQYDNKKKPFSALEDFRTYLMLLEDLIFDAYFHSNNITKETIVDNETGSVTRITTYQYEYNEDDFPTKITRTLAGVEGSTIYEITYQCN